MSKKEKKRAVWDGPPVMYEGRWVYPGDPVPEKPHKRAPDFEDWVKQVYGLDPKQNIKEVEA